MTRDLAEDWRDGGFGLYLHWPFCAAKCPYCDFNSHVAASIDQDRWAAAYLAEIDRLAGEAPGRVLNSVYFGGGTPSLMRADVVAAILDRVAARWPLANDVEVTLEANPGSVEADRFAGYAAAGVNRVSLGVQALNDADLRRLGRIHSSDEALRALDVARAAFGRVSFDLIYARQDQTLADWRAELGRALALGPDHLSMYQLTIEPGTAFYARHQAGGLRGLPDEDLGADMYALTQEMTAAADLPAYEVSNHAAPGNESRHNLIYWRAGDWGGIGPGAHGRLTMGGTRWATETPLAPGAWLEAVEAGRGGEIPRAAVPDADRAAEYLMMGLRLSEGLDLRRHAAMAGHGLPDAALSELTGHGLIEVSGGRLRATPRGRAVLNAVIRELLP